MKNQDRTPSVLQGKIKPILLGLCVGVLCTTLLLLLMALIVRSVDVPRGAVTPLAVTAAAVGAFAAGLTAALAARRNGLLLGAVCGLVLFLIILVAGNLRFDSVDGSFAAVKAAVLTVAGAIGGVLGVNRRRR